MKEFSAGKLHDDFRFSRVETPFSKVDVVRTDFLSLEEARQLIDAADPEFRPMLRALIYTGCRYGEVCNLKVRDFQRGRIVVRTIKAVSRAT